MMRMRMLSGAPPKKPAMAPMNVPMTIAKPTVMKPTWSETRDAVDDPAELVAQVRVEAHQVLRLVGRAAQEVDARRRAARDVGLAQVEQRHDRIVRRDERREDGDQEQEREDDEPDDRGALAQDVAQRVAPQRAARGLSSPSRAASALGQLVEGGAHPSRIRGSRKAYDTSTTRLTTR